MGLLLWNFSLQSTLCGLVQNLCLLFLNLDLIFLLDSDSLELAVSTGVSSDR